MHILRRTFFYAALTSFFIFFAVAYADTGTIDPNGSGNYKAKLLNDPGLGSLIINFGKFASQSASNIIVTDNELRGFAWGELVGWIVVNCADTASGCSGTNGNFKVANDGDGLLSGYAWGENTGWINFGPFTNSAISRVKIAANGEFGGNQGSAGYAWSENFGWIVFDCSSADSCVETDWNVSSGSSGGGGGGGGDSTPPPPPPPPDDGEGEDDTPPPPPPPPQDDLPPDDDDQPPSDDGDSPTPPGDDSGIGGNGDGSSGGGGRDRPDSPLPPSGDRILSVFRTTAEQTRTVLIGAVTRAQEVAETLAEAIQTPVGVATTAAATGVGLASSLIQTLTSSGWRLFASLLGLRSRRRKWGTVYDSVTKQPLDPAYVVAYDRTGKEAASAITDLDGRYGFLLPPGEYRLEANKTHYQFPSARLLGKNSDGIYDDLYLGEFFTITQTEEVVAKNIPLDPLGIDWNEEEKRRRKLFYFQRERRIDRFVQIAFQAGFTISAVAFLLVPTILHAAVLLLYVLIYIVRRLLHTRRGSVIVHAVTGKPVPFALVRVYGANSKSEMARKVASAEGKFYCLIANGTYFLTIETRNPDGTYTLVFTSPVFTVAKGIISDTFKV